MRIALFGAGRMAASLAALAQQHKDVEICAVVSRKAPGWPSGVARFEHLEELRQLVAPPEVIIDFSLPDGTEQVAVWSGQHKVALLSGVTGLQHRQLQALDQAALTAPVLWSPNLSLGINLLASLARQVAAALPADAVFHISDVHHRHKKDAPSGTALMLGERIDPALAPGRARPEFSSVREGEVIGQHEIRMEWAGESLSLCHTALDRSVFARGALSAAHWLVQQPAGRYSAEDWLAGL